MKIKINKGHAIIDEEDSGDILKYKWRVDTTGYASRCFYDNGKVRNTKMHRQILKAPEGYDVDHINGDRLDNRRENIRICTRTQNCMNSGPRKGSSQYKGVSFHKQRQKWQAKLQQTYLGLYECEIEAAKTYDRAAYQGFGEYAFLNFPEDMLL